MKTKLLKKLRRKAYDRVLLLQNWANNITYTLKIYEDDRIEFIDIPHTDLPSAQICANGYRKVMLKKLAWQWYNMNGWMLPKKHHLTEELNKYPW